MRLLQLLPLLALAACGQPKQKPSDPVAKVGSEIITAAELDSQVGGQVYDIKKQALEQLVQQRMLEAKAKKEGVSGIEALMDKVIPQPTDAEAQALYDQAKASGRELPPFDAVKGQIIPYLKQQKFQEYVQKVKAETEVKILLPPYRVAVDPVGPAKGKDGAPITIVEFSDYECPFCQKAEPTVAQILSAYPDKVRLVFRDFPLPMHPHAPKAAEAAHCAKDQGKFWEMHEKLFANNTQLQVENLKKLARDVGLDGDKFDKCLDSNEKSQAVSDNMKAGQKFGVNSTPAFFVNGRLLSGALPFEEFKKVIDEELAAK